jgi:hypothetical protein
LFLKKTTQNEKKARKMALKKLKEHKIEEISESQK